MRGAGGPEELPPPVRYTVEPGDLAVARARQTRAMKRDTAPVLSNLIPIAVGLAYAGAAYLVFKAVVPRPVPIAVAFLACLAAFGVSVGGLTQWAIMMWNSDRAIKRLDGRIAASAAGGEATAALDADALTIASTAGVSTRCAYEAISSVDSDDAGLFVTIGRDLILYVPRRAFAGEEALDAWVSAIGARIRPGGAAPI